MYFIFFSQSILNTVAAPGRQCSHVISYQLRRHEGLYMARTVCGRTKK